MKKFDMSVMPIETKQSENSPLADLASRHKKRSDAIADGIKTWILHEGLKPGDRLPKERQLADHFQCAKGTLREALKSLEVQGLIALKTGPTGGPVLIEVSYKRSSDLLRNFLQFQDLNVEQIYELRKIIEVEIAVSVVGQLDEKALDLLEQNLASCCASLSKSRQRNQLNLREKELDFHNILADHCPNPLLAFHGRFLTDLLRDFIEFQVDHMAQYEKFTKCNIAHHRDLVDAFRAKDKESVRSIMTLHMNDAEAHTLSLNGVLSSDLMLAR
jgi:GntR family transcriptional repressor for pyruvate dehydrogenase complex